MTPTPDETAADGEDPASPGLGEDRDLVDRLTLLGRALGNPVRVRIAAAMMRIDEAGPRDLANLLDDSLGNLSYHVRYLHNLGFLRLERMIPRRGAVAHKYSIAKSLRRALPAAAQALGEEAHQLDAEPDHELGSLSYFLVGPHTTQVITAHSNALTRVGKALSADVRTDILGYLLQHDVATTTALANDLNVSRSTVARHLRILADQHMVRLTDEATRKGHWTVTPPTRKALAGFKDLLLVLDERPESAA